jgi:hypothetical protein
MKTSTRRILGATVLGISLAVGLALYFSGTPLLSLGQWDTTSFPGGGSATSGSIEIHWPFVAVCGPGFLGLIALVWPQRKPPRLQL